VKRPEPKPLTRTELRRGCECGGVWMAVEYRGTTQDYDGCSEWECQKCGVRIGRWSGRELSTQQIERRYGGEPVMEAK
jgi:hypothetical protein